MWTNPYKGKKADFSGINCCGKSTQLEMTHACYRGTVATKEPYTKRADGSPVDSGVAIYAILKRLHPTITLESLGLHRFQTEHFFPNRLEHFREVVIPNLMVGRNVLSDRGPASMCFGAGTAIDLLHLMSWHHQAFQDAKIPEVWADAILIYDITPEESMRRLALRSGKPDGQENLETQARVRMNYLRFAEMYPHCHVIDGSGTPEEVFVRTRRVLDGIL
jgi:thymidylate kinase